MSANKENRISIPVRRNDLSVFDEALIDMKERFVEVMRRLDQQMNKFSSDLSHLYGQPVGVAIRKQDNPVKWENLTSSPLIQGEGNEKKLVLQFDVSQFEPNEVEVNIVNEVLSVTARHEEKSANSEVLRQYYRHFVLPRGTAPESVESSLSKDGILVVKAPWRPEPPIDDESDNE